MGVSNVDARVCSKAYLSWFSVATTDRHVYDRLTDLALVVVDYSALSQFIATCFFNCTNYLP